MFADVILPLPVEGTYTYRLPAGLEGRVQTGQRVIVPFGTSKQYSGIVTRIHNESPGGNFKMKELVDVLEEHPILTPQQLRLWQWMASYYLCPVGDVYKAALPSGLKLASESVLQLNEDFDQWGSLRPKELQVYELLKNGKANTVAQLQKQLKDSRVMASVRSLMEKGALTVKESIENTFRPKTESHVRLAPQYLKDEATLHALLDTLTPKRLQMVSAYLDLAGVPAALTLKNPKLIQEVSKAQLLSQPGTTEAILSILRVKGIMEVYKYEIGRLNTAEQAVSQQLPLSESQQTAFNEINDIFREKSVCLLHGVTSSGKTEVYIRLIREQLAQGKQVLYLLPEIALTTQITNRLRRIFGSELGVYHSRFPDTERVEIWQKQLSGKPYGVMLGARSALFLPFQNLGLVIVDEEHETSYKQQDPAPRYNARDVAIVLASFYGAKTLLGTATPSLETYWNTQSGKYGLVKLMQRFGNMQLPKIEVADVKELLRTKQMKLPFSPRLIEEIKAALQNKEQVILFQNRRGYAPVVECAVCGWTPTCETCDVTLTYHQKENRLVCHYCGKSFAVPKTCPNCESTDLRQFGFGTEKIEEEVHHLFPDARTARLDLDTTRARTAYERILGDFANRKTDILIGTQMVSKGLDFDGVHVVGILDADAMLTRPDFRSFERAFQMMAQVAGRSGRRGKQGYVILQTRRANYPIIDQVIRNDYKSMYEEQLAERQEFHYPPFYRLIYIQVRHRDYNIVEHASQVLASTLRSVFGDRVLGPDKPPVSRVQLMFIRKIAIKIERQADSGHIRDLLRHAAQTLAERLEFHAVQLVFDVDPL